MYYYLHAPTTLFVFSFKFEISATENIAGRVIFCVDCYQIVYPCCCFLFSII